MERRKFLIGMGGTAIGASALVGSGAFSFVSAERSVSVNVADDSDAYLGLIESSPYAEEDDGELSLNFDGEGVAGEGVNDNAFTDFRQVFQIRNQGTRRVRLSAQYEDSGGAFLIFTTPEGTGADFDDNSADEINTNNLELDPGERSDVAIRIDLTDSEEEDIPDEVTWQADEV